MQFIYHKDSSKQNLTIDGDLYKYIFKVRRLHSTKNIFFRNLEDKNIYEYKVLNIDRKKATLELIGFEQKIIEPKKELHIAWCIIDPKSIEKYIASLNELGVTKITFIYCQYSQKQYKPNLEKLKKLLINSSSQCGRSSIIELDICDTLQEFIKNNPNSYMFNFSKNNILNYKDDISTIIIGCEGGFSKQELESFDKQKVVGIDNNLILKSETAVLSVACNILN